MKIKEVENLVGIKKTNIRFYEREGLLNPERSENNNYREYSEEDVRRLKEIKNLRLLGIPTSEIRLLFEGEVEMQELLERRLVLIEQEEKDLQEMRRACRTALENQLEVSDLDDNWIFEGNSVVWKRRLADLLETDIVEEMVSTKQLNQNVFVMLLGGYLVSAVMTVIIIGLERSHHRVVLGGESGIYLLFLLGFLSIGCMLAVEMSSNPRVHLVTYGICSVTLAPFILLGLRMLAPVVHARTMMDIFYPGNGTDNYQGTQVADPLHNVTMWQFVMLWVLIMVYVIVLYVISKMWENFFTKIRYTLLVTAGYAMVDIVLLKLACEEWKLLTIAVVYLLFFIGMNWTTTVMDRKTYNRYYALKQAGNMMNLLGMLASQFGRNTQKAWMK